MNLTNDCPFCGSSHTFPGSINPRHAFWFTPHAAKDTLWKFMRGGGIQFGPSARACAECGKLWSSANPQEIKDYFESYGTEAAQAKLNETDVPAPETNDTPPPGLPRP